MEQINENPGKMQNVENIKDDSLMEQVLPLFLGNGEIEYKEV